MCPSNNKESTRRIDQRFSVPFTGTQQERHVLENLVNQLKNAPSLVDLKASFGVWDTTMKFILMHSQLDAYLSAKHNDENYKLLHALCIKELSTKVDENHWRVSISILDANLANNLYAVLGAIRNTYRSVGKSVDECKDVPTRFPGEPFTHSFHKTVQVFYMLVPAWYKPADALLAATKLVQTSHQQFYPNQAELIGQRIKQIRPAFEAIEELEGWFRTYIPTIDGDIQERQVQRDVSTVDIDLMRLTALDEDDSMTMVDGSMLTNGSSVQPGSPADSSTSNGSASDGDSLPGSPLSLFRTASSEQRNIGFDTNESNSLNSLTSDLTVDMKSLQMSSSQENMGDESMTEALDPVKSKACDVEMQIMRELQVFTVVNRPTARVLPSRWVFTASQDDEEVCARVAAQGREQVYPDDHLKLSFSRPERSEVMAFLLTAAKNGWHLAHVGIKHPYFHTDIDCTVYIEQPDYNPKTVWKLNKGVLGLKQAPRLGWKAIKTAIQQAGYHSVAGQRGVYFKPSKPGNTSFGDPSFFEEDADDSDDSPLNVCHSSIVESSSEDTFVLLNEDRCVIGSRCYKNVIAAREELAKTFEIVESEANIYFGLNVVGHPAKLTLDSHMHTQRLVESFDGLLPRYTEEYANVHLRMDDDSAEFTPHCACSLMDIELAKQIMQRKSKNKLAGMLTKQLVPRYQSGLTMVLNIARSTRPDLMPIATFLSQFTKPRNHHWNMLLKVVDYVRNTLNAQLNFPSFHTSADQLNSGSTLPSAGLNCYVNAYAPNLYSIVWVIDNSPFLWTVDSVPGSKKLALRAVVTGVSEILRENRSLQYLLTVLGALDPELPMTIHYTGKTSRKDLIRAMHYLDLKPKHKRPSKEHVFESAELDKVTGIIHKALGLDFGTP